MQLHWEESWWSEMLSEIPQIEVITAIGEAELEDYVSQLLFTQGWSIIYRAFDATALQEFMAQRSVELRTVIVYTSDLPDMNKELIEEFTSPTVTTISLDETTKSAHEIMQKIRSQLRLPMLHSSLSKTAPEATWSTGSPQIQASTQKVIVVTGSCGAPGKTLIATALASEISKSRKVTFIDADFRNIPLTSYFTSNEFSISRLSASEKPTKLPEGDLRDLIIVDVGVLPPLGEVVNDRRWSALLYNNIFDVATQLIYICKTSKASLMQLDQFRKEFPVLMKKVSPTYICVLDGQSKELRQAQAAFLQLVGSERNFQLPPGCLLQKSSGVLDSLLGTVNKGKKEIGSIAASLI